MPSDHRDNRPTPANTTMLAITLQVALALPEIHNYNPEYVFDIDIGRNSVSVNNNRSCYMSWILLFTSRQQNAVKNSINIKSCS